MNKKTIGILSNVTIDMIAAKLRDKYNVYIPCGYDAWISEVFDWGAPLYTQNLDAVFLLLDGTECRSWKDVSLAAEHIILWEQGTHKLAERIREIPIFISTVDVKRNKILSMSELNSSYEIETKWTAILREIVSSHNNCFIYDLKESVTETGRNNFYSEKMWYMGGMPFSRDGIRRIADDIDELLTCYYTAAKKVIVLDLDNTLWGGVIGEDGVEGIELSEHQQGQRFYDFQKQLLEMKNRGALLAINSKNNMEDVKKVFEEHPCMLLKWNDFVSKKVNWSNKAQNIKELEKELNLTESSFVFVDDNPIEREMVAGECPEVTVLDFPEDTTQLISFAENFYNRWFRQTRVLAEDAKKTEMYLAEEERKTEMSKALNLKAYISKLEMQADIHPMTEGERERVVQLCNKTNQFNVTTKRYTEKQIMDLAAEPANQIYTVHSRDKYGEAGLISVLIVKKTEHDAAIDTFLMSCRVMGRELENIIMGEVLKNLKERGIQYVTAEYVQTAKNVPVKKLFERLGFSVIAEENSIKRYQLDLNGWKKPDVSTYKKITFQAG